MGSVFAIGGILLVGVVFFILWNEKSSDLQDSLHTEDEPNQPRSLHDQYQAQLASRSSQSTQQKKIEPIKNSDFGGRELIKIATVFVFVACFGWGFKKFILEPNSSQPVSAAALVMPREQYQNICLGQLKPVVQKTLQQQLEEAFGGGSSPSFDEEMAAFAHELGFASFNSLMTACAQAEARYNPSGEDRLFNARK